MNGILISHDESGLSDDKCPRCNAVIEFTDERDPTDRGFIKNQRCECPACGGIIVVSLWYSVNVKIDLPREDWPKWRKEKFEL